MNIKGSDVNDAIQEEIEIDEDLFSEDGSDLSDSSDMGSIFD